MNPRRTCIALVSGTATGCAGVQSSLEPAGTGAHQLAQLFWWMLSGSGAIWLLVTGLCAYAVWLNPKPYARKTARRLVIVGGVAVPFVVLSVLLTYGLTLLPPLLASPPAEGLRIHVTGEQWWWRVRYATKDGEVELANEVHLPVNEPVEFLLRTPDVIHSFWIPSLGGKMDMLPGRETRLTLFPTREGRFRGACAEFCGASHAWMAFDVVVESRAAFERWLVGQQRSAQTPVDALALRGAEQFTLLGCGACHVVRGTSARGTVGPDLTHVGSRSSLAAATLPNTRAGFRRWLERTHQVKPGARMPAFAMLSPAELDALAAYLESLE